jgi:hypothetical protein
MIPASRFFNTSVLILLLILIQSVQIRSQEAHFYVDETGIIRNAEGMQTEGFGVNYTVPFAHAFRSAEKLGIDIYDAMDQDVYHFSRLGFDLYRVHVWDTEISDTLGNLINNEHLKAFDYLLAKLASYDINYILTPIAFWGNGWPEPAPETPGFSHKYGKDNCLTNQNAIIAQQNYLTQFMAHINPYTGIEYKNDPRLIAMEISNEPHHKGDADYVTNFVSKMVKAVKKSGYAGPIFYNTSHGVHFMDAYFDAGIDGGTFQWYPTGLGYQQELPGNYLPNVDQYFMPFDETLKERQAARIVYEFDAADIGKSYMYPAIARSFRKAGIQLATHFSYDPSYLAYANTEYNTHYMNLAYAPHKALALKICSEIFHDIPLGSDFGTFPNNTHFGDFVIDQEHDMVVYNSNGKYFHTNGTNINPKQATELKEIAGRGNCPLVKYDGTGAYFLDKIVEGIWRLEVMPDVLVIDNLFGRNSLDKTVAVIQWNTRKMKLDLKDIGASFSVHQLNAESPEITTTNGEFNILPGSYLVRQIEKKDASAASFTWKKDQFNKFHAPGSTVDKTYIVQDKIREAFAGNPLEIKAQVISPDEIKSVKLEIMQGWRGKSIEMEKLAGFKYSAEIPAEYVQEGFLNYYILVETDKEVRTFPADRKGHPFNWDFWDRKSYQIKVLNQAHAITLFNAANEPSGLSLKFWPDNYKLMPTDQENEREIQIELNQLHKVDTENLNASPIYDYTMSYFIDKETVQLNKFLNAKNELIIKARSLDKKVLPVQLALVDNLGVAYGAIVELGTELKEYRISLKDLKQVKTVIMPRPYPTFLPYYFEHTIKNDFKIESIQKVQLSIGPGLTNQELKEGHGIGIVSVKLK